MNSPRTLSRALRGPLVAAALAVAVVVPGAALASAHSAPASSAAASVKSSAKKPTVVLVHGAWADSSSWDNVIPILQREGYPVLAAPNPLRGLTTDVAYVKSYLSTVTGPVILVGHSYGGAVISDAATGNPNVKALVYIDAFAPVAGETLGALAFKFPGSCLQGGTGTTQDLTKAFTFGADPSLPTGDPDLYLKPGADAPYPGFNACFANDGISASEGAVLSTVQRPLAAGAFADVAGQQAFGKGKIPAWALIGTQDRTIPPATLTFMAKRANATIEYVNAGHLSMISHPVQAAGLIAEAARATR
jgi:pimeloyl-ACP methyl ester carboxylesterase